MQKTLCQHLEMVYKSRILAGNLCCTVSQERFLARKMRIPLTMSIVPTLFLGVEYCATFQAALYIETHSLMHQSEFHAASVALSRAADKRKSLINIHKNGYTATLRRISSLLLDGIDAVVPRLGEINLPVLIIHGSEDTLVPIEASNIADKGIASSDKTYDVS